MTLELKYSEKSHAKLNHHASKQISKYIANNKIEHGSLKFATKDLKPGYQITVFIEK